MKKIKLLIRVLAIALLVVSCQNEDIGIDNNLVYEHKESSITDEDGTRTVDEIQSVAIDFIKNNLIHKFSAGSSSKNLRFASAQDIFISDIDVLQYNDISKKETDINTNMMRVTGANVSRDTLLYALKVNDGKEGLSFIMSANKGSQTILAILDDDSFSFDNFLKSDTENNPFSEFMEMAILYNLNPTDFVKPDITATQSSFSIQNAPSSRFVEEVLPKLQVEWSQGSPFNKYCPNNYPAGCVAIAAAQAFTVTRHAGSFNSVPLNYDNMIKVKNSHYASSYPAITDTVAMFIRQIGVGVGMNYDADGSGAQTADAAKLFSMFNIMNVSKDKRQIKNTLKNYENGIVLISSRTKKDFLFFKRGKGHAYLADGYKVFADGTDLIHINYGWGPGYNGYFLTNLVSPSFTSSAPSAYPYSWAFYCIYK